MQTRFLPSQRGKQSHQRLKSLESLKALNSMALAGQEGPNVHMAACIARHVRPKFFERNLHSVPCKKDNTSWFPCLITQDIHVLRVVQMMLTCCILSIASGSGCTPMTPALFFRLLSVLLFKLDWLSFGVWVRGLQSCRQNGSGFRCFRLCACRV